MGSSWLGQPGAAQEHADGTRMDTDRKPYPTTEKLKKEEKKRKKNPTKTKTTPPNIVFFQILAAK